MDVTRRVTTKQRAKIAIIALLALAALGFGIISVFSSISRAAATMSGVLVVFAPLLITLALVAPGLDRAHNRLLRRGFRQRDAAERVQRNALWILGPMMVVVGVWGGLLWWLEAVTAPSWRGVARSPIIIGSAMLMPFVMGAIWCWHALWWGKVVGEGRRCARCGAPAEDPKAPICDSCGRVFAFGSDITDGYLVRPRWMWALAIIATVTPVAIFAASIAWDGRALKLRVVPTGSLMRHATHSDFNDMTRAWVELERRPLTPEQRANLTETALAGWERDLEMPYIAQSRELLVGQLREGRLAKEQVDRLTTILKGPPHSGVAMAWLALLEAAPPSPFEDTFADAFITAAASGGIDPIVGRDWLAQIAVSGSMSSETFHRLSAILHETHFASWIAVRTALHFAALERLAADEAFPSEQPALWAWLLSERFHNRVTPEQARTIDEIAERLDHLLPSPEPTP